MNVVLAFVFCLFVCYLFVILVLFGLQRHGKGKMRTCTKNLYDGDFNYDQIHGEGKMTYANQDTYMGRWKYGMVSPPPVCNGH